MATITLSQSAKSIVITTIQELNADELLKHQAIWKDLLPATQIKKDEKWFKVIAHGIPTATFNIPEGMQLIQEELKTFNKWLNPCTSPQWLTPEATRKLKRHASIILGLSTEQEARKAIRNRLQIGGQSIRVEAFNSTKPSEQCLRCQQFGHTQSRCSKEARCKYCAGLHAIRDHKCRICKEGSKGIPCAHTIIKCTNCKKEHQADSKICEISRACQPLSSSNDELSQLTI